MSRTFRDSIESDLGAFFNAIEFAVEFTLSRGLAETAGVAAITGPRIYERVDGNGGVVEVDSVDFDLAASAYLIDGVAVDPQAGDRFGNGTDVWEVMPLGRRKCFEPADGDAMVLRVHTRKVVSG
jgi:hypothetical protein